MVIFRCPMPAPVDPLAEQYRIITHTSDDAGDRLTAAVGGSPAYTE